VKKILFIVSLLIASQALYSQKVLDEIIAVVGSEIILASDVQIQKNQIKSQGYKGDISDCEVLEEILFEKIMLNQAKVDSVEVTDDMVESELEKRLNVFIRQIGSEKALEEYYGKSMGEIREEFFDVLKDQILVQRMQGEINSRLNVTPEDVSNFYQSIPSDSLPFVNASVEMAQIVKYPETTVEERERVRTKLRTFKQNVESGDEEFETLAALYSDDPGSASKGGNLGMKPRGTWVPEFDAVAFKLKDGEISAPFETDYGFHIMQMIERRGEMYDANHILLIPDITAEQLTKSKVELDSIRTLILNDSIGFPLAASKFSDHERSRNQNGMIVNQKSGSTIFEMHQLDPTLFLAIDTLEINQVSKSFFFQSEGQDKGYRIVKLINRTKPHRASMQEDYQMLQNMASENLKGENMDSWMRDKINQTYIKIVESYQTCSFGYPWLEENEGADNIK